MKDLRWMGSLLVVLVGCGPAVQLGDTSTGATTTGSDDEGGSEAPLPTTSATSGAPIPGTTGAPESCFVGQIQACTCPDGVVSQRECGPDRIFSPCECGDFGSSGWWGSSGSSGGWVPDIPELPPGEVCLPPSLPCEGDFFAYDDESLAPIGICSVVRGSLFVQENVTSLAPLGCLTSVDGSLLIDSTQLLDLSGLEGLERADLFFVFNNPSLLTIDAPNLGIVDVLIASQNASLMDFDLGSLASISNMEVTDNPLLPGCAVVELIEQANPGEVSCSGNLEDACSGICG